MVGSLIIAVVRIVRLYCPTLVAGSNLLSEEEAHHAAKVLRLHEGDRVVLFNGVGSEAGGVVGRAKSRGFEVRVESIASRPFETRHRLTLAVALAKTHRHAYLVEKCTELGVAALWPILAERSVTEPGEAAVEKWTRRAVEAAKQSHRSWVPAVADPQPLDRAIARIVQFDAAVLADPDAADPWPTFLAARPEGETLLAFVGPEGGFTAAERDQLLAAGAHPVRLSATILRTETAAVALCAAEAAIPV